MNKTDQEKKKEFKVTGLDENKPQLRYYPNVATGKVKSDTSFQILFDKSSSSIDNILEEIEQIFEYKISPVAPQHFNDAVISASKEHKKSLVYALHNSDQKLPLGFKAISMNPIFQETAVFMNMVDPPLQMFPGLSKEILPIVGIVAVLDDNFVDGEVQQSVFQLNEPYVKLIKFIGEKVGKSMEIESFLTGNELKRTKRNFGEITSDSDFKERCLNYKKACAIGVLSG